MMRNNKVAQGSYKMIRLAFARFRLLVCNYLNASRHTIRQACVSIRREFDYLVDPLHGPRGINDGTKLVANRVIRCNNTLPPPCNKFRRALVASPWCCIDVSHGPDEQRRSILFFLVPRGINVIYPRARRG